MADEAKPSDSASAPAGTQTGTPAATAAPATDTSQVELQRLRTELGIARKREEDTRRAYHQSQAQVKALQSQSGFQAPDEGGRDSSGGYDPVLQATIERVGFFTLASEAPEAVQYAQQIRDVLADPERAAQYANPDPYVTFRNVYKDLRAQATEAENAELRKQLEARNAGRESLKAQAVTSGSQASENQEPMTTADLEKMSAQEMEQKFGKAALLGNLTR